MKKIVGKARTAQGPRTEGEEENETEGSLVCRAGRPRPGDAKETGAATPSGPRKANRAKQC